MTGMRLQLRVAPPCSVDAAPLTPAALAGKSRDEVRRLSLQGWNASLAVGDLFRVTGAAGDRLVLEGIDARFVRVGAALEAGELRVDGDVGDYAGEGMRGGTLLVDGHAGDFLGAGMKGGRVEVRGDTGAFAGSGRAGEMTGMAGGTILVRGSAGDRAGDRMRRGQLLVQGDVGAYCGARMLAGTIAVLGRTGVAPGYLMRRGTMIVAGDPGLTPLPTFNDNGPQDLLAVRLLLASLASQGPGFRALAARRAPLSRWLGDLGCDGKGELLIVPA